MVQFLGSTINLCCHIPSPTKNFQVDYVKARAEINLFQLFEEVLRYHKFRVDFDIALVHVRVLHHSDSILGESSGQSEHTFQQHNAEHVCKS